LLSSTAIWTRTIGGDARRVTTGYDSDPAWSPDGRFIAFVRLRTAPGEPGGTQIWVTRPDGSGARPVTDPGRITTRPATEPFRQWGDLSPDWSPDSRSIVFRRQDTGLPSEGLWITKVGGKARKFKTYPPSSNAIDPAWSPDQTKIAFSDIIVNDGIGVGFNIETMNVRTRDRAVLTSQPDPYNNERDGVGGRYRDTAKGYRNAPWNTGAAWSPDGRRIAFQSNRHHELDYHDSTDIYVMDADGSNVRRLTTHPGGPDYIPAVFFTVLDW
jgi:Tol biopolymer transport system component